jgi:EREBP-like factor
MDHGFWNDAGFFGFQEEQKNNGNGLEISGSSLGFDSNDFGQHGSLFEIMPSVSDTVTDELDLGSSSTLYF